MKIKNEKQTKQRQKQKQCYVLVCLPIIAKGPAVSFKNQRNDLQIV